MSVITCPNCRTPAPPGAIFCDNCGYDLRAVAPVAQQQTPPTFLVPQSDTGEMVCPNCQHANIAGSAFCENCGAQLTQAKPVAPAQPPAQPAPQPAAQADVPPAVPSSFVTGRLVIQETNVSLTIPASKTSIIIGREDPVSGVFPDIDLDPHGGHEAGVGRRHAQILSQGGQMYIEDLDSVNGTIVNKQKISSRQPYLLHSGDELRLGKMALVYYDR